MSTNSKVKKDLQELNVGSGIIELYQIDASNYEMTGDSVFHITPGILGDRYVKFNGVRYDPMPIDADGFEYNGDGKMPRPTIRVSNINYVFSTLVRDYDDLTGAKVTRMRTYKKYLDGQSEADPNAQFPRDVYYIERKTRHNKNIIEWELKSKIDLVGVLIPRGQVLQTCTRRYRVWDSGAGSFIDIDTEGGGITCPYVGEHGSFDTAGNKCADADDKCGRDIFHCQRRFREGDSNPTWRGLPTNGFPAIGTINYPYR